MTSGGCWKRVRLWGRVTISNDPDGPKWTAWSVSRWRDRGLGETGGSQSRRSNGQELALRTALNGRRRGWDGDEVAVGERRAFRRTHDGHTWTARAIQIVGGPRMDDPWRDRRGRVCVVESVLDYFVLPLPLPLSLPLPSVRGESGELTSESVSLPFRLPFRLPLPCLCPFLFGWIEKNGCILHPFGLSHWVKAALAQTSI